MIKNNSYLPTSVQLVKKDQQTENTFTLHLAFTDKSAQERYHFRPGQFNMLYAYGLGEVPISMISAPDEPGPIAHTVCAVGHVTQGLAALKVGDHLGLRGPFGNGWPIEKAKNKNVMVISGGLGCAPLLAANDYLIKHHQNDKHVHILHGVRHYQDWLYKETFQGWQQAKNTTVLLACEQQETKPGWHRGLVTELIDNITPITADQTICFICGPHNMMRAVAEKLQEKNIAAKNIFLSLERNMQCGIGHCGHCQCGNRFVCKDGPVFAWNEKGLNVSC